MDQIKIGKLIAECRKEKKLTQTELATLLGVSDKSVSKWENGICLPEVSLYKRICQILGITLNEFFAGERVTDEEFKDVAEDNLQILLENNVFTLKDKIVKRKKEWEKKHSFEAIITFIIMIIIGTGIIRNSGKIVLFGSLMSFAYVWNVYNRVMSYISEEKEHTLEMAVVMSIILLFIGLGMYFELKILTYNGLLIGFIYAIEVHRRTSNYIVQNIYGLKSERPVEDFKNSVRRLKSFKNKMENFEDKKEAISYLVEKTGLSEKECREAYCFILGLNLGKGEH